MEKTAPEAEVTIEATESKPKNVKIVLRKKSDVPDTEEVYYFLSICMFRNFFFVLTLQFCRRLSFR